VLDAFAVDEDIFLSSLFVEEVDFAELTEVTRVLPAEEATATETLEDPAPEALAPPPPPLEVLVNTVANVLLVAQYSSNFVSTTLTFL
jgi:hypothetical protein